MKFVLITGPQAVGKMTVGQELVKITNLKLLHNHMTIELLTKIFDYSRDSFRKLNEEFRVQIFEEFAKSNEDGIIYIVELESSLEERLKRNKTENRLENKASKRNLEWSEKDLLKSVEKYRFNSRENEIQEKNYIKIDNTNISADIVAKTIKEKFKL